VSYDDDIEMWGQPLSGRLVRARKEHACVSCRRAIKRGDIYWRGFWIVDGEPFSEKRCVPCISEEPL
jgi:hypothetical protein